MGCDYAAGVGLLVLQGPFCFLEPSGRRHHLSQIGPIFWTTFGHPAKCPSLVLTDTYGDPEGLLDGRYGSTAADSGADLSKNGRPRHFAKRSKMDSANSSCLIPPEYEFRPLYAQHLVRCHKAQAQPDAHIGNLDAFR